LSRVCLGNSTFFIRKTNKALFSHVPYGVTGETLLKIYSNDLNASDAERAAAWLGQPCDFTPPPPPGPADPTCAHGVVVCAHKQTRCVVAFLSLKIDEILRKLPRQARDWEDIF